MGKSALLIAIGASLLAASVAEAKQYRYVGAHPLSARVYCYVNGPHVHTSAPFQKVLFRERDQSYFYVGDPVAHGYTGRDRYVYYGHHPIHLDVAYGYPGVEFCYLDGPHYHAFRPSSRATFELRGGVYWYLGKMRKRYRRELQIYAPINTVHPHVRYSRPVVTIAPPPGYVELRVGAPQIVVPAPSVPVQPAVIIEHEHRVDHRHGKKKHWDDDDSDSDSDSDSDRKRRRRR